MPRASEGRRHHDSGDCPFAVRFLENDTGPNALCGAGGSRSDEGLYCQRTDLTEYILDLVLRQGTVLDILGGAKLADHALTIFLVHERTSSAWPACHGRWVIGHGRDRDLTIWELCRRYSARSAPC